MTKHIHIVEMSSLNPILCQHIAYELHDLAKGQKMFCPGISLKSNHSLCFMSCKRFVDCIQNTIKRFLSLNFAKHLATSRHKYGALIRISLRGKGERHEISSVKILSEMEMMV